MRRHERHQVFPKHLFSRLAHAKPQIAASETLLDAALRDASGTFDLVQSRPVGLTSLEAAKRLAENGPNVLTRDQRAGLGKLFLRSILSPLVILLAVLALISFATGDPRAGSMMALMIVLGVGLKLSKESRAENAAARLKAMISVRATVVRDGVPQDVPVSQLVRGDVVRLCAGDMIPGDVRIVEARDLFVSQASLTGESYPVEKFAVEKGVADGAVLERTCIAFLGTNVESGSATVVVVATGAETYLGTMAETLSDHVPQTAFDRGVRQFTWMMLRIIAIMVPLVFLINGLSRGEWTEAFFFAVAVAVGLTPEMLPMIVAVCLSKGAIAMSRRKVIVKRINAIQNLGAMDVLCTDKTGTLTMDQVILEKHCDVVLNEDAGVLELAYINSYYQTGLKSLLDRAILTHPQVHGIPNVAKVDEIPFDFERRVMSVVVRTPDGRDRIITKGAPEAVFARCTQFELDGVRYPMQHLLIEELKEEYDQLSADGFRVLAVASREIESRNQPSSGEAATYSHTDERELILNGYVAFLDPPKDSARAAIRALEGLGVSVKVVTGDNDLVARKICKEVGLPTDRVLLGADLDRMSDVELAEAVAAVSLFARVSPAHKRRIIEALRTCGHVVGFMGDGINDAPALRTADVGISVDAAVDVAKESADLILLEKSLLVLETGVIEGRRVFANILKYVRMGASSNFGNMFSVLGASAFVPFLPMAPIQILANNLMYDLSQTAIPTDDVDPEQIEKPRPWDMKLLSRYILFIGPCSSLFDFTTFFAMLYLFNCWNVTTPEAAAQSASLFQTGWFLESLITQTMIIHVIRTNRIPFLQSRASWPLLITSTLIIATGIAIPYTLLGRLLGFTVPPAAFWPLLALTLVGYMTLTQFVKMWLLRRKWI